MLLLATLLDAAWVAALRRGGGAGGASAARVVAVLAAAVAAVAVAGFCYWGVPYVYGVRISHEATQARKWRAGWIP